MKLSDNIKNIRKENNLSQEDLANMLGVSRQSVSKWESNAAYPEMDKIILLSKKFNININDLLSENVKEKENTREEGNLNKFIDSFLNYITKTVNMFTSMSLKQKIKCLFEQAVIITFLIIIFLVLGVFLRDITNPLLNVIKNENIYMFIYSSTDAIYSLLCLILGIIIVLNLFKTRYLNYYEESFTKPITNPITNEEPKEKIKLLNKEEVKEKVIIRDPKHSEYSFIKTLFKIFIFIFKCVTFIIALFFIPSIILLSISLVVLFLFMKTGLMFWGALLSIIALIGINYVILKMFISFIFNHKSSKTILSIIFFMSLITLGVGIGLCINDIPNFNIKEDNSIIYKENIKMKDNLIIDGYKVNYIETKDKDIKIEVLGSKYSTINIYHTDSNYYYYSSYIELNEYNVMDFIRKIISSINNKEFDITDDSIVNIYTNKENINKLKKNITTSLY